MDPVQIRNPGGKNQEIGCHHSQNQADHNMNHNGDSRVFLISRRKNDIVVLHLLMGKSLGHPLFLRLRPSCVLLHNGHIIEGLGIALVNLQNFVQGAASFGVVLPSHVEQSQKQMGLDKMRPLLHHPGQLEDCQVVAAVLRMPQGLIKGLDILALHLKLPRLSLNLI